jgi:hypothetical protein
VGLTKVSSQALGLRHVCLCSLTLAFIAMLAASGAAPGWALVGSLACVAVVRKSLSPLVLSYIAYVLLSLVIAPRFGDNSVQGVETAEIFAALWIVTASLGGALTRLRKPRSAALRTRPIEQSVTPALAVSVVSLVTTYALLSANSFGVAGQYATGVSGGGYLGLLAAAGPPSAAGALLTLLGRPSAARRALVVSAGLVVLEAVSLATSGFRGAAPLYIIAVLLCSVGVWGPSKNHSVDKRVFASVLVIGFVTGVYVLGVSVRENAIASAGLKGSAALSISNILPTVIQRFDESRYIDSAQEFRNDPAALAAVSFRNQVAAIVPRALFPDKGIVDYGQQVGIAIYGEPTSTRNSSTVTTFGDALINLGLVGAVIFLAVYVFAFDLTDRKLRSVGTLPTLSVRVVIVGAALDLEAPAVLNVIGMVRISLMMVAMQWVVKKIAGRLTPEKQAGTFTSALERRS